jgi:hypothetical protein
MKVRAFLKKKFEFNKFSILPLSDFAFIPKIVKTVSDLKFYEDLENNEKQMTILAESIANELAFVYANRIMAPKKRTELLKVIDMVAK